MKKFIGFCLVFLFLGTSVAFSQTAVRYRLSESALDWHNQVSYVTVEDLSMLVSIYFYLTDGSRIGMTFKSENSIAPFRLPRDSNRVECLVDLFRQNASGIQYLYQDGYAALAANQSTIMIYIYDSASNRKYYQNPTTIKLTR